MRFLPQVLVILAGSLLLAAAASAKSQVLMLTDPVHGEITRSVAAELKDKADFKLLDHYANTSQALENLDKALGDQDWDVIYFNFGLGDLVYRDPKSREFRVMSKYAGGVRTTSPEQYARNLEQLVKRLEQTGAKLIWGTITPMENVNSFPSYTGNLFDEGSGTEYNLIAAKIMSQHGIAVCDVHSFIMSQYGNKDKHPGFTSYVVQMAKTNKQPPHKPVIEELKKVL